MPIRKVLLILLVLLSAAIAAYVLDLATPKRDYFIGCSGVLTEQEIIQSSQDGVISKRVRLEPSSGLSVDMRVVRPKIAPGETLPVIVVMGGEGTGEDAVDLVGAPHGVTYIALDHPYEGDQELDAFWESLTAIPDVQQAFLRAGLARLALLLVFGNSFETLEWIPEIAPRPPVIVAARDDDFVPPEAQQPFVEAAAASEHIEFVWTEGRHIRPNRPEELQQLLDIMLSRVITRDAAK